MNKVQYLELYLPMPELEPMPVLAEKKEERGFVIIIGGEDEPASGPVFPRPPGGREPDARD
jgi:hypothetical protein